MKRQFGVDMNKEDKIQDSLQIQEELFDILKIQFIKENRLLKRYYEFCVEYQNYEYDEMGMNMEDGEDLMRKAIKIRTKFMKNIQDDTDLEFSNITTDTVNNRLGFNIIKDDDTFEIKLDLFEDSFDLEIAQINKKED
jgi:hypothetical protein